MFNEWGFDDMPPLIPQEAIPVSTSIVEPEETEKWVPDLDDYVATHHFIGHCLADAPRGPHPTEYTEETGHYHQSSLARLTARGLLPPLITISIVTPSSAAGAKRIARQACTKEDDPVFAHTRTWRIVTPPPLKSILKGRSVYLKVRAGPFSSSSPGRRGRRLNTRIRIIVTLDTEGTPSRIVESSTRPRHGQMPRIVVPAG